VTSHNRRPQRLDVGGVQQAGLNAAGLDGALLDAGAASLRLVTPSAPSAPAGTDPALAWRAQTELILNAAGEGIYGLDLTGRCTFVNPAAAQMTGHDLAELLGQSMHDIVHHSHPNGCSYTREECPIYAAFSDGLIRNACDEVFWRKNGTSFPVEYTSTPIFNNGVLCGAVVVFRDISIRRQTEERLRKALSEVQRLKERLLHENQSLRQAIESVRYLPNIVGSSAAIQQLARVVTKIGATDSTVLIQGETGTGKELVATAIHRRSARHDKPLIKLNCAAVSANLIDSELFGHEKGAFTGAVQRRAGRFEQAHGGTLFLDEVGELPLDTQAKLLRVLQEQEFERVGGNESLKTDVRILAATNRPLKQMVHAGTFRADLYFRLSVLPVSVPSLRERTSDIPELVAHFLKQLESRFGRQLGRVSESGLRTLAAYHWPGNVRELLNAIEQAAVLSEGDEIEFPDATFAFGTEPCTAVPPSHFGVTTPTTSLGEVEKTHILTVLEKTKWRLSGPTGAGAILGLHPNTLRHRMKKLGIVR
jgi:formate hydrogenlyase transcriptional activator